MKKHLYILVVLFFLPMVANSQYLTILNEFKPFEQIGDTIFYNKNKYSFVLTNKKREDNFYEVKLLQMRSLDELKNKLGIDLYKCIFKQKINQYFSKKPMSSLVSYQQWYWNKKPAKEDFVKIKKTNGAFYLEENNLVFPGMKKDTTVEIVILPLELFPDYQKILKIFYSYLNFELGQHYFIYIKIGDTIQIDVRIPILCNPEIKGTGILSDSTELNKILNTLLVDNQIKWPKLKIEDTTLPYLIPVEDIGLTEFVGITLENLKTHAGLSKPVFTNNDSVRMYIDSLNYKTLFFIPNYQNEEDPTSYCKIINGYPNLSREQVDINNDGIKDFVLDTVIGTEYKYNGTIATIEYIPNYSINHLFTPRLSEYIIYSKYLGNNYYYTTYTNNQAEIFLVKNNQVIPIMGVITNNVDKKGKVDYSVNYIHTWLRNDPDLTRTYPERNMKAWHYSYLLDKKINFYLEHSEKLPIDFPMN